GLQDTHDPRLVSRTRRTQVHNGGGDSGGVGDGGSGGSNDGGGGGGGGSGGSNDGGGGGGGGGGSGGSNDGGGGGGGGGNGGHCGGNDGPVFGAHVDVAVGLLCKAAATGGALEAPDVPVRPHVVIEAAGLAT